MPPRASMSWNTSQAFCASSLVNCSTNQEPPAGSLTRPRLLSSWQTIWMLRATRRANASGLPSAKVKGRTQMASAPPSAAPAQAIVVRRILVQGSRRAIMRYDVGTLILTFAAASPAPQASATRQMSLRAARSLAMVANWSASAASAIVIFASMSLGAMPARSPVRRYETSVDSMAASSCASLAPARVIDDAVGRQGRDVRHGERRLGERDGAGERGFERFVQRTLHGERAERIGAVRTLARLVGDAAFRPDGVEGGRGVESCFAGDEGDGADVEQVRRRGLSTASPCWR